MFSTRIVISAFAFLLAFYVAAVSFPRVVFADEEPQPVNIGNPLASQDPSAPERGDTTIQSLQISLGNLLETMLRGIAALSLLPIVVGGFQLIISQGNEDKITRGKQTLYFGVVGLVLALLAIAIFRALLEFVLT